jgi:hypothetical protein
LGLRLLARCRRLGLEEVLEPEENENRQQAEIQQGFGVATAAAAAGAASLRLKIWILIFGQRKRPVLMSGTITTPLCLW